MHNQQNLWKYLFLASVLLWIGTISFSCEQATNKEPEKEPVTEVTPEAKKAPYKCKTPIDEYQLKPAVAQARIASYDKYAAKFPPVDTTKVQKGELINPDVRYFQLPHCELSDMIASVGEGADVKAHLAIKDVTVNGVVAREIVLVFEDTSTDASLASTGYYDFVTPCPHDCK